MDLLHEMGMNNAYANVDVVGWCAVIEVFETSIVSVADPFTFSVDELYE